jgi:hypothetical protein
VWWKKKMLSKKNTDLLLTIMLALVGVALISVLYKNIHSNKQTNVVQYDQSNTTLLSKDKQKLFISVIYSGVFIYNIESKQTSKILQDKEVITITKSNDDRFLCILIKNKGVYIIKFDDKNKRFASQRIVIDNTFDSTSSIKMSGDGKNILIGMNDNLKRGKVLHYTLKVEQDGKWQFSFYKDYFYPTENLYNVGFSVTCNFDCSTIAIGCPTSSKVIIIQNAVNKPQKQSQSQSQSQSQRQNTETLSEDDNITITKNTPYHNHFNYDEKTTILFGLDQMILDYGYTLSIDDKGEKLLIGTSGDRSNGCFYYVDLNSFAATLFTIKNSPSKPCSVSISPNGKFISMVDIFTLVLCFEVNNFKKIFEAYMNPKINKSIPTTISDNNELVISDASSYYLITIPKKIG